MKDETLNDFYSHDHRRLDDMFSRFQLLKHSDMKEAKAVLDQFRSGLQQHMAWEEAILFCEYEDRTVNQAGSPTEELRMEHHQILAQLDIIEEKLAKNDLETEKDEARFLKILADHNRSEESGIYVSVDKLVGPEERVEILKRMKEAKL